MVGNIKMFSNGRGFGFISADDGNDYYVHITSIMNRMNKEYPAVGAPVTFDIDVSERGKAAVNVVLI